MRRFSPRLSGTLRQTATAWVDAGGSDAFGTPVWRRVQLSHIALDTPTRGGSNTNEGRDASSDSLLLVYLDGVSEGSPEALTAGTKIALGLSTETTPPAGSYVIQQVVVYRDRFGEVHHREARCV